MASDRAVWDILNAYFEEYKDSHLVKHLLDSYNDFVASKLEQVIEGFNPIQTYHQYVPEADAFRHVLSIDVSNPVLMRPTIYEKDGSTKVMTPYDARVRNFSYASQLYVDLTITARTLNSDTGDYSSEVKRMAHVPIGRVPVMVKSKYCVLRDPAFAAGTSDCRYDYGGYFIVNGNEKVVISQDRIAENKTFVFLSTKVTAYSHIAEVRSVVDGRFGVPKTTSLKLSSKPNQYGHYIKTTMHHIKHDIPLFVLFRALGLESDRAIIEAIVGGDATDAAHAALVDALVGSADDASGIADCQRDALEYLARYLNANGHPRELMANRQYRLDVLRGVLERDLLPHVGPGLEKKALYLAYMANKLLRCFLGMVPLDDRDSYVNKRVDTPGVLLGNLFRQYYGKLVKDVRNMLQKEVSSGSWRASNRLSNVISKVNINKVVKSTIIESGLKYGLATGNWGVKSKKTKQGVAQVLNRMTYAATISHLRRINTPIEKSGKIIQPRKLHATQWGVVCPCECFDPQTPILMWDGSIKAAKEIVVGDYLINDAGNAVKVKSTCAGFKGMYEVVPDKKNFMSYTVTDNHILTLLDNDNVVDITIDKYLSLPKHVQDSLYVFKSGGINWERKEVALDPYILGMWLGGGDSKGCGFATADKELLDKWIEWGAKNDATITHGCRFKYSISSTINRTQSGVSCNTTEAAPLAKLLRQYGLVNNKHIPREYLVNDRATRLAVLAGLVDTDGRVRANGHEIRICQGEPNYRLLYDAEFLAGSLGFSCNVREGVCTYTVKGEKRSRPYKELTITGSKLYEIPTVLPSKKLHISEKRTCCLKSSFKLIPKDVGPFVGWQLDGNGRFLLGDRSVSHNTPEGQAVGLVKNMALMAGITVASCSASVRELAAASGVVASTNPRDYTKGVKVIVNGDIVGYHQEPAAFVAEMHRLKRTGVFHPHTGIAWDVQGREVSICTEGGRCVRPLFVVGERNTPIASEELAGRVRNKELRWADVVMAGAVEYLDVEDANRAMIAMRPSDLQAAGAPRFTHMEMHPSLILGVLAGSIPFSDHNQAPRNTYQCLWECEPVLMADGSFRAIRDVKVGDRVVTFDPATKEPGYTRVVHQYVRPTTKPMKRITTVSGRSIIATEDHKFMTERGWTEVRHMEPGATRVAVYAGAPAVPAAAAEPLDPGATGRDATGRVITAARLAGMAAGGGSSALEARKDAGWRMWLEDTALVGATNNNNSSSSPLQPSTTTIPEWVLSAPQAAKREYLAGFHSADCCTVDAGSRTLRVELQDAQVARLGVSMDALLREFGITVKWRSTADSCGYTMDLLGFAEAVGFRYCADRIRCAALAFEAARGDSAAAASGMASSQLAYATVLSVEPVPDALIADITTESSNHSFIGGDGFAVHNSAMGKQAIGLYSTNFRERYDTVAHVLNYPQKPLVQTRASCIVNTNEMPCGVNVVVAIATFTGYNQEDSVIMNQSAIDRGLFQSTVYKTVRDQNNKNHSTGEEEFYCRPDMDSVRQLKPYNYNKIDETGFVPENTAVEGSDIIIGKCMPQKMGTAIINKDTSIALKGCEKCFIDRNASRNSHFINVNGDGYTFCKIRTRADRIPTIGDKFASRHAQKGTCGMVFRQEDMPFSKDGLVPDIIINPHAIPSRMTIAQLMECIMGKACSMLGTWGDATPFTDVTVEDLARALESAGLERYGNEVLYNSRTGEQMDTPIFIGPTFYQRLKHMTADKVHSRASNGPVVMLTRQPAEGRARDGGLRLGEMEIECNWAHGSMQFLKERIMECSDNYRVFVCRQCGMMATAANPEKNIWSCKECKNTTQFAEVRIPYAAKLLFQEVQAMGIATRFHT